MNTITAAKLSPLLNGYTISAGPPRTIVVPKASALAGLQDITVSGMLLKRQVVTLDEKTNRRTAKLLGGGGYIKQEADGDLHFALGTKQLQPHIACELQNAKAILSLFNQAIGKPISISGFFRCMFEHPGFHKNDDAHIFEIHPVRAVSLGGAIHALNVDIPEQKAIHPWDKPFPQDGRIKVTYGKAKDTLTFTGMDGMDTNYEHVKGTVSAVKLNATGGAPASFTFTSPDIGRSFQAYCLQGTTAARQLRQLKTTAITMVTLRNVDLGQALKNTYAINLLAIDIQPA